MTQRKTPILTRKQLAGIVQATRESDLNGRIEELLEGRESMNNVVYSGMGMPYYESQEFHVYDICQALGNARTVRQAISFISRGKVSKDLIESWVEENSGVLEDFEEEAVLKGYGKNNSRIRDLIENARVEPYCGGRK